MRARIGNRIGDNCFLKIGMVGIIIRRAQSARVGGAAAFSRGETSFTPRSRFNALKRLEATKQAVSRDYADQRLARAETKPAISFGFRFAAASFRCAPFRERPPPRHDARRSALAFASSGHAPLRLDAGHVVRRREGVRWAAVGLGLAWDRSVAARASPRGQEGIADERSTTKLVSKSVRRRWMRRAVLSRAAQRRHAAGDGDARSAVSAFLSVNYS